jgi:hypothetical protein
MRKDQIFVLLLIVLLPLSGCMDGAIGDADAQDSSGSTIGNTTVINYYNYTNITSPTTLFFESGNFSYVSTYDIGEYGQLSSSGSSTSWGYLNSVEAEYVELFTLSQSEGQNLKITDFNLFATVSYVDCADNHTGHQDILLRDCMDHQDELVDEILPVYSNAAIWDISCSNGLMMEFYSSQIQQELPFGGEDCDYTFKFSHMYNIDMAWWNVNYDSSPILN